METFFKERHLSPRTVETYRGIINRYLSDWLDKPITSISKEMIRDRHRNLIRPTRCGTDNRADADRAFHTLRSMMNFAKNYFDVNGKSLDIGNPVREAMYLRWHHKNVRNGTVPDDLLAQFYQSVMKQPNKTARDFIWILLFTAMRRNEVTNLRWADVDLDKRTFCIPPLFNKSRRLHQLPMTDILFAVFQSRKALNIDSPFVFPGRADGNMKTGHMCEPRAVLLRIRKEIGLNFIWHDLRRTALSAGEKAGLPYLALQKIANHAVKRNITNRFLR